MAGRIQRGGAFEYRHRVARRQLGGEFLHPRQELLVTVAITRYPQLTYPLLPLRATVRPARRVDHDQILLIVSPLDGGAHAGNPGTTATLITSDSAQAESLCRRCEEAAIAITRRFGPADLRRCRLAVSPAFETLSAIRLTSRHESPGRHQRWLDSVRPKVDALDLRPITLLQPRRGYTPDVLSPPPTGPLAQFDDDLARIAATPPNQVSAEIALSLRDTPGASDSELGRLLLGDPGEVLNLLTKLIREAWHALIEPVWPPVRALLNADVGFQTRRLAEGGLGGC
jgi:hypothetical protein